MEAGEDREEGEVDGEGERRRVSQEQWIRPKVIRES